MTPEERDTLVEQALSLVTETREALRTMVERIAQAQEQNDGHRRTIQAQVRGESVEITDPGWFLLEDASRAFSKAIKTLTKFEGGL